MTKPLSIQRACILLVVVILFVLPASSQSDSTSRIPFVNTWAMEFGISSNFTLSSFLGPSVSLAKYLEEGRKMRLGVYINSSINDLDDSRHDYYADSLYQSVSGIDENAYLSVNLTAHYLHYSRTVKNVSFFFGYGPFVAYSSNSRDDRSHSDPPYDVVRTTKIDTKEKSWELGVSLVSGVEWFFAEQMSVHAEYMMTGSHMWRTNASTHYTSPTTYNSSSRSVEESSTDSWRLYTGGVLFGLTVCY